MQHYQSACTVSAFPLGCLLGTCIASFVWVHTDSCVHTVYTHRVASVKIIWEFLKKKCTVNVFRHSRHAHTHSAHIKLTQAWTILSFSIIWSTYYTHFSACQKPAISTHAYTHRLFLPHTLSSQWLIGDIVKCCICLSLCGINVTSVVISLMRHTDKFTAITPQYLCHPEEY